MGWPLFQSAIAIALVVGAVVLALLIPAPSVPLSTSAYANVISPFEGQRGPDNSTILAFFSSDAARSLRALAHLGCPDGAGECTVRLPKEAVMAVSAWISRELRIARVSYFRVQARVTAAFRCPVGSLRVALVAINASGAARTLDDGWVSGLGAPLTLDAKAILKPGDVLEVRAYDIGGKGSDALLVDGFVSRDSLYDSLDDIFAFDATAEVRYFPFRPTELSDPPFGPNYANPTQNFAGVGPLQIVPWLSNIIPANVTSQPPFGTAPLARDGYSKYNSIVQRLGFYMGLDMRDQSLRTTANISIFLLNREDRGPDNFRKKLYMSALTSDVLPLYGPVIDAHLNRAVAQWTTYGKPVMSSYRAEVVALFIEMHFGRDVYPQFIFDYFSTFVEVVAASRSGTERREIFLYGAETIASVRAWVRERLGKIIATGDNATLTYHWARAGLSEEGVIMEAIHNIIAFTQFNNIMDLIVRHNISLPVGDPARIDFVRAYNLIIVPHERLNVVRELFRITVPNSVSFSRLVPDPATAPQKFTLTRHLHQPMMLMAEAQRLYGNPMALFDPSLAQGIVGTYRTLWRDRYENFSASLEVAPECSPLPDNPARANAIERRFQNSPIDGETLIDPCRPKIAPVFATPQYTPFGLGYRRCPGEGLTYLIVAKLLNRLSGLEFVNRTAIAETALRVPVAPFKDVPDSIYVRAV